MKGRAKFTYLWANVGNHMLLTWQRTDLPEEQGVPTMGREAQTNGLAAQTEGGAE